MNVLLSLITRDGVPVGDRIPMTVEVGPPGSGQVAVRATEDAVGWALLAEDGTLVYRSNWREYRAGDMVTVRWRR